MQMQTQVTHIRATYGDYFGITVAGYPGMIPSFHTYPLPVVNVLSFYFIFL